jgi:hypothetical protein
MITMWTQARTPKGSHVAREPPAGRLFFIFLPSIFPAGRARRKLLYVYLLLYYIYIYIEM